MGVLAEFGPSTLSRWLGCPQRAMAEHVEPDDRPIIEDAGSVSLAIGDAVHAQLTGHEPQNYKSIVYDPITRNEDESERMIKRMVEAAQEFMKLAEWKIVDKELEISMYLHLGDADTVKFTGHIDAIVESDDGRHHIIDFKTGTKPPHNAMTQMAGYAFLVNKHAHLWHQYDVASVGVVYIPRTKKILEVSCEMRDYEDMVAHGELVVWNVARLMGGVSKAYYNPSAGNCRNCPREICDFRIFSEDE